MAKTTVDYLIDTDKPLGLTSSSSSSAAVVQQPNQLQRSLSNLDTSLPPKSIEPENLQNPNSVESGSDSATPNNNQSASNNGNAALISPPNSSGELPVTSTTAGNHMDLDDCAPNSVAPAVVPSNSLDDHYAIGEK